MADIRIFNPAELNKPRSPYMQVARVKTSEFAFIARQVSVDSSGNLVGQDDFDAQCAQVFGNVHAALRSVGADWEERRGIHDLRRSLARCFRFRRLSPPSVLRNVSGRTLSAQYAAGHRASRPRNLFAGSSDRRSVVNGADVISRQRRAVIRHSVARGFNFRLRLW